MYYLFHPGRVHRPHSPGGPAGVQVLPGEEGGGERGQAGQGGRGPGVPAAGPTNQAGGVRPGRGTKARKIVIIEAVWWWETLVNLASQEHHAIWKGWNGNSIDFFVRQVWRYNLVVYKRKGMDGTSVAFFSFFAFDLQERRLNFYKCYFFGKVKFIQLFIM